MNANDSFYNPYAFVPADRRGVQRADAPQAGLGEGPPFPLGRLHDDHWTGRLRLILTAESPLLLTRVAEVRDNGHRVRETRRDPRDADRAELLATAVKGMLRAAYEAATNSRFGVFAPPERLTRRARSTEAAGLVPARVAARDGDSVKVELLYGFADPDRPSDHEQHAAWVPRYVSNPEGRVDPRDLRHGDAAWALLAHFRREPRDRQSPLLLWRVVDLASTAEALDEERGRRRAQALSNGRYTWLDHEELRKVHGWYFQTNRNIATKHDERLFFSGSDESLCVTVPPEVVADWQAVLDAYRAAHQRGDLAPVTYRGRVYGPDQYIRKDKRQGEADRAAWSPFIYDESTFENSYDLAVGTLCYAEVATTDSERAVRALFPVAISRRAYAATPRELATAQRTLPVEKASEASPADRVFGWAATDSARRGRIHVGMPRQREVPDAAFVQDLPTGRTAPEPSRADPARPGVPLAVLSSPKPTQELFYAGTVDGQPHQRGASGFMPGGGLRGRKVYPAHPQKPDSWTVMKGQPWRRPDDARDDQNATLRDWVPPGAQFEVDLRVEDLSAIELGALVWVLDGRRHRLGMGRPYGFGTVRTAIDWEASELRDGAAWRAYYTMTGDDATPTTGAALQRLAEAVREKFERETELAWGDPSTAKRVRTAVENSLTGFPKDRVPVRYPTLPEDLNKRAEHFRWFAENSKGQPRALGDLAACQGDNWSKLQLPNDPRRGGGPTGRRSAGGSSQQQERRRSPR